MTFLPNLSETVLAYVLSEWLLLEELAAVDSSVCNSRNRGIVLRLMKENGSRALRQPLYLSISMLTWLDLRGLNVSGIESAKVNGHVAVQWGACPAPRRESLISKLSKSITSMDLEHIVGEGALDACCSMLADFSRIHSAQMSGCPNVGRLLAALPTTLKSLSVSDSNVRGIERLLARQSLLRTLSVVNCGFVNFASLLKTKLSLSSLKLVDYSGSVDIESILPHCGKMIRFSCPTAGVSSLEHLCKGSAASLTSLNVSSSDGIKDSDIEALVQTCTALTDLDVSDCKKLTDLALFAIVDALPGLLSIGLRGLFNITDASALCLFQQCSDLKTISLAATVSITDAALLQLANCSELQDLDLNSKVFTASTLDAILHHCPRLTHLSASLAGTDMHPLTGLRARGRQLATLRLENTWNLSDEVLLELCAACPSLTELNIEGCRRITNASLFELLFHCHSLNKLSLALTSCVLSDALVDAFVSHQGQTLRWLSLLGTKTSLQPLLRLLAGLPRLRYLSVDSQAGLSNRADDFSPYLVLNCM